MITYRINGYGEDFDTGTIQGDRQVLMGLLCPHLVAYTFSCDGELQHIEVRDWNYPAPRMGADGPYKIHDPLFLHNLTLQFTAWWQEIGFHPQSITVQSFFDEERFVGIQPVPDWLIDGYDGESDEGRLQREQDRQEWYDSGSFVFWWAKNYFMSPDGEVEST